MSGQRLTEIPEQREAAEIILLTALNRLRAMGYAVEAQADAGDRICLLSKLYPVWRGEVLRPLTTKDVTR